LKFGQSANVIPFLKTSRGGSGHVGVGENEVDGGALDGMNGEGSVGKLVNADGAESDGDTEADVSEGVKF
jgi:hypothetical protein